MGIGMAVCGRLGMVVIDRVGYGLSGEARPVQLWRDGDRRGRFGTVWRYTVRPVRIWHGRLGPDGQVLGSLRRGRLCVSSRGLVESWRGTAGKVRHVGVGSGGEESGSLGLPRRGMVM